MNINFIISIILSVFLGFSISLQHFLLSGMSPFLEYLANGILVILILVIVVLYLFQKSKIYKLIQLGIAFLCIFSGIFSQFFIYDFDNDQKEGVHKYKTQRNIES
jgi:Na+/H+ antiporter NhaC